MELMVFLLEEELEIQKVHKNNGELEVMLEKAMDA